MARKKEVILGVNLGDLGRDRITGYEGVVVAITTWLNGCVRITLQPRKLKEHGDYPKSETLDAHQVELVSAQVVVPDASILLARADNRANEIVPGRPFGTGGPSIAPTRPDDPR